MISTILIENGFSKIDFKSKAIDNKYFVLGEIMIELVIDKMGYESHIIDRNNGFFISRNESEIEDHIKKYKRDDFIDNLLK